MGCCYQWAEGKLMEFDPGWLEDEDMKDTWKRLGYASDTDFGDIHGYCVRLLCRTAEVKLPFEFVADVGEPDSIAGYIVFLPDMRARLDFLALVLPGLLLAGVSDMLTDMKRTQERMFRVQHERDHVDSWKACDRCDPQAHADILKYRAELSRS